MSHKIIIADDDEILGKMYREIVVRALPLAHIEVVFNGEDLVSKARQESYDLVLSDDNMPRLNGLEAYNILRTEGRAAKNYFLITTVLSDRREKEIELSGIRVIHKPVSIQTLTNIVEKSLKTNTDFGSSPAGYTETRATLPTAAQTHTTQSRGITNLTLQDQSRLDYQI
ncbi:MAG TPA: response regulator [Candidatus Nanoarchaeia archaeon]|nr:response regulator [Candidatus Nanoarchaeia archaeon]